MAQIWYACFTLVQAASGTLTIAAPCLPAATACCYCLPCVLLIAAPCLPVCLTECLPGPACLLSCQGAFQIPLHIAAPRPERPFRADSLESIPRVPCASLLIR